MTDLTTPHPCPRMYLKNTAFATKLADGVAYCPKCGWPVSEHEGDMPDDFGLVDAVDYHPTYPVTKDEYIALAKEVEQIVGGSQLVEDEWLDEILVHLTGNCPASPAHDCGYSWDDTGVGVNEDIKRAARQILAKLAEREADAERRGRIDELETLKTETRELTHPPAFVIDTDVAQSIRVHTNTLVEYRLADLRRQTTPKLPPPNETEDIIKGL